VLTALHLLRRRAPVRVVLVESLSRLGRGVAYGTTCEAHLLNVPAHGMSAYPDDPDHFLDWAQTRRPGVERRSFLPRRRYGEYLEWCLDHEIAPGPSPLVHRAAGSGDRRRVGPRRRRPETGRRRHDLGLPGGPGPGQLRRRRAALRGAARPGAGGLAARHPRRPGGEQPPRCDRGDRSHGDRRRDLPGAGGLHRADPRRVPSWAPAPGPRPAAPPGDGGSATRCRTPHGAGTAGGAAGGGAAGGSARRRLARGGRRSAARDPAVVGLAARGRTGTSAPPRSPLLGGSPHGAGDRRTDRRPAGVPAACSSRPAGSPPLPRGGMAPRSSSGPARAKPVKAVPSGSTPRQ
jgi:FAD-NAD(P)-binding